MRRSNSFTSSSDVFLPVHSRSAARRGFRRKVIATLLSTLLSLTAIDITTNLIFGLPANSGAPLTSMQRYFDYGRSVEGKLRRMVGIDSAHDDPIVDAGWLGHDCRRQISMPAGKISIEIYGNSFTNYISDYMEKLDPRIAAEDFAGPAAPLNHSYACFVMREHKGLARAPIQMMGVLAGTMRRMVTITGLTTTVEQPQPFTYPRYTLTPDGKLIAHWASIQSVEQLRMALKQPAKWREFLGNLADFDGFYAPEMVTANFADHSVILRMLRRAWGQRIIRDRTESLHMNEGFSGAPEIATVARAMLIDFAERARAAGQRPIVLLIEDQGHGGALLGTLGASLKANQIDFLATGNIANADDPHNFVADGHFTPLVFSKIAQAALRIVDPDYASGYNGCITEGSKCN